MSKPKRPIGAFVVNGWYLELPGLVSPHFQTLSGLSKKTGIVEVVDGGTGIKYKFADQILDFGQITLARTYDGSSDDSVFRQLVDQGIKSDIKYAGALVKLHYGQEAFRIAFEGLGFKEENYPDFNTEGSEKLLISYLATVDSWLLI